MEIKQIFLQLIVNLELTHAISKQLHYDASGATFYGNHLLFDRIDENLLDFVDEIKENFYMANDIPVPTAADIISTMSNQILSVNTPETLSETIKMAIENCNLLDESGELESGEVDLIGKIANALMKKLGFLNRLLISPKE